MEKPTHWEKKSTRGYTACGIEMNGLTSVANWITASEVTCKKCLKYLAKTSVCPNCGCEFEK